MLGSLDLDTKLRPGEVHRAVNWGLDNPEVKTGPFRREPLRYIFLAARKQTMEKYIVPILEGRLNDSEKARDGRVQVTTATPDSEGHLLHASCVVAIGYKTVVDEFMPASLGVYTGRVYEAKG